MAKRDVFQIDPYGVVVQVQKSVPKEVQSYITPQTLGYTWVDPKDEFLVNVWFKQGLDEDLLLQIIVHETQHILQFVEDAISIDRLDDESQAYLVQWVFAELANRLLT